MSEDFYASVDTVGITALPMTASELERRRTALRRFAPLLARGNLGELAALIAARRAVSSQPVGVGAPSSQSHGSLNLNGQLLQRAAEAAGLSTAIVSGAAIHDPSHSPFALQITTPTGNVFYIGQRLFVALPDGNRGAHFNGPLVHAAGCKHEGKARLTAAGVPTPEGQVFAPAQLHEALLYAAETPGELCVKPNIGANGVNVFPWLRTADEIIDACVTAAAADGEVVVEQSVGGEAWRFFWVADQIVGTKVGRPASVVGDGHTPVAALIEQMVGERTRRQNPAHRATLPQGPSRARMLARQGLDLSAVPALGRRVFLGPCANGSRGADTLALPDGLHPGYHDWMHRVFAAFPGVRYGAVDVMIRDRARPTAENFDVLEVNVCPSLAAYHFPWEGPVQDVAGAIAAMLRGDAPPELSPPGYRVHRHTTPTRTTRPF